VSEIARSGASAGLFPIDVVIYPDVLVDRDYIAANVSQTYEDHLRIGGAKLTIDGSPQGFTALHDRPYDDPVGDYPPGYAGHASASMDGESRSLTVRRLCGSRRMPRARGCPFPCNSVAPPM
jgi:predicted amidohydrolase YtcJ